MRYSHRPLQKALLALLLISRKATSMNKKKHPLQKVALIVAKLCFLISIISAVFLYLKVDELGTGHPVSASFLASVFFFAFVGILLSIVGKADIPDLKIRPAGKKD